MKELRNTIQEALAVINALPNQPFVLKGGTALMECYGLDRMSVDIDLDGVHADSYTLQPILEKHIAAYSEKNNYTLRVGKNTETVQKLYLHYNLVEEAPLKIEVSYRRAQIEESETRIISGYKVYTLDALAQMKASAYLARDKIRDLYDLVFICDRYFDDLAAETKRVLLNAFEYKDIAQFDYLVRTQDDTLIDKDLLAQRFLGALDKLGLIA
ncbi:MAG: nucleotidyl transferase AbiEii/AbiGii toxin family protein [Coriobacteriia bacterium]|nr:nucleotidyl transferase AbiEii/AbiGii toxin family protein [Coriobacteriia bacterium]